MDLAASHLSPQTVLALGRLTGSKCSMLIINLLASMAIVSGMWKSPPLHILPYSSFSVAPLKGNAPVSRTKRMMPRDQISAAAPEYSFFWMISGAMYEGVPQKMRRKCCGLQKVFAKGQMKQVIYKRVDLQRERESLKASQSSIYSNRWNYVLEAIFKIFMKVLLLKLQGSILMHNFKVPKTLDIATAAAYRRSRLHRGDLYVKDTCQESIIRPRNICVSYLSTNVGRPYNILQ